MVRQAHHERHCRVNVATQPLTLSSLSKGERLSYSNTIQRCSILSMILLSALNVALVNLKAYYFPASPTSTHFPGTTPLIDASYIASAQTMGR